MIKCWCKKLSHLLQSNANFKYPTLSNVTRLVKSLVPIDMEAEVSYYYHTDKTRSENAYNITYKNNIRVGLHDIAQEETYILVNKTQKRSELTPKFIKSVVEDHLDRLKPKCYACKIYVGRIPYVLNRYGYLPESLICIRCFRKTDDDTRAPQKGKKYD